MLEIVVANLWPNRMIGNAAGVGPRISQSTHQPYKADTPLLPSGLRAGRASTDQGLSPFPGFHFMFRLIHILGFCLFVLTGGCERSRALGPSEIKEKEKSHGDRMELKLMSFNVRYETPDDRDEHAWSQRVIGAVRAIREASPDVIGVQEALHGQAADLWASLPEYEFFGRGRDDGCRGGEYSGIFFRRDRFEPVYSDGGMFWLSDTPGTPGSMTWGNEFPRVVTWIRLVDRKTGNGCYVFNTHWDHANQNSRENSAMLLAERIDGRQLRELPVVLLGDFNALVDNPGVAYLSGQSVKLGGIDRTWNHRLIDAFQQLHPADPNRSTLHHWYGNRAGLKKIDHILVSEGAEVLEAAILDQRIISDHFPVTARVVFSK